MVTVDRFGWQEGELNVSQCWRCRQYRGRGACAAFPVSIPDRILTNEHDHTQPYPGDNGIRFEPLDKASPPETGRN